jgi:S1-C subfamily serine protease
MSPRRLLVAGVVLLVAVLCFSLGSWSTQHVMAEQIAANDARNAALRDEMALSILQIRQAYGARPTGTSGQNVPQPTAADDSARSSLVDAVKQQLQSEMGLFPVRLLRQRRDSFVELNASDNLGNSSYGTAGYLGDGYFITVKHAVIALGDNDARAGRRIVSIGIHYKGKDLPARVIDSGNANTEVHPGDWAIIKVRGPLDVPALQIDPDYAYQFADPVFRLGNDYAKGIILSTGYVGERTVNGLVTCLTDGHPGASGGGVLDQEGHLVGIPVGRMPGDYRFSFILPLRAEMFRKVPGLAAALRPNS